MKIQTEFFQGENQFRNGNGEINKNILRDAYRQFLTSKNLPWEYRLEDLIEEARKYRGPQEVANLNADAEWYNKMVSCLQATSHY